MSEIVNVPKELTAAVVKVWNESLESEMRDRIMEEDLFVVWSSKVLQNWKGLVGSTRPKSPYFEVTHNGNNGVTYVDVYKKIDHKELYEGEVI